MDDFEKQMNAMLTKAGGLVNLTIEEREEVTQAEADVLKDEISVATKAAGHYNPDRKEGDMKHLADSVVIGNLDGTKVDGNTAVGFSTKDANHARIAGFINDGTAKMSGDSFYDKAVVASKPKVFEAGSKKLAEIQERKSKM